MFNVQGRLLYHSSGMKKFLYKAGLLAALLAVFTLTAHGVLAETHQHSSSHCCLCQTATAPACPAIDGLSPQFTIAGSVPFAVEPAGNESAVLVDFPRGPPSI
jgi:hypothetical protein